MRPWLDASARPWRYGLAGRVHWQLIAKTGHTSADALAQLQAAAVEPADVLVTALGVNDVVSQVAAAPLASDLAGDLDALARQKAQLRYSLHSAVPPMHAFPLLPQPLRWLMGAQAMRMNRALGRSLWPSRSAACRPCRPICTASKRATLMARDGFHPGPAGYAVWAETLADRIAKEWLKSH